IESRGSELQAGKIDDGFTDHGDSSVVVQAGRGVVGLPQRHARLAAARDGSRDRRKNVIRMPALPRQMQKGQIGGANRAANRVHKYP
ncbi:MAG: hypothetical protein WBI41_03745, partial [Azovibrio sp.]|uniref:hypothetical protein n=1 Tax=Azovibrio sp. TaxID=1872673 RepID=UPI003C768D49